MVVVNHAATSLFDAHAEISDIRAPLNTGTCAPTAVSHCTKLNALAHCSDLLHEYNNLKANIISCKKKSVIQTQNEEVGKYSDLLPVSLTQEREKGSLSVE